jgi:putative ABC transport system permease protein
LVPDAPFEFGFMDDQFASLYQSELQLKRAADVATALNFLIIALGIFGIVSFTLAKRSKEIAVRKVLGAELRHLTLLFVKDYTRLIILANLIAWPITYWTANKWLEGYAYRINQSAGVYLLVCLLVFVLAYGLIAGLCANANRANPVDSLRDE